jgi:hypothetical protein
MTERIVIDGLAPGDRYDAVKLCVQNPEEFIAGCDIGNAIVEGYKDSTTGELSNDYFTGMRIIQSGLDIVNYATSEGQYSHLNPTQKTALERGMFAVTLARTSNKPKPIIKPSIRERIRIRRNHE